MALRVPWLFYTRGGVHSATIERRKMVAGIVIRRLLYVEQLSLSFDLGYDQNNSEYIFFWVLFLKNFSQGNVPEENLLIDCLKINEVNDCCDVRGKDFIFSVYSEKLVTFRDKVTCSLHQILSYKDQVQDTAQIPRALL